MIMMIGLHTGYVNTTYSSLSFGTVYRLLWRWSSFTKYSHTAHWRFLPDNSFTKLILLDNLSQSIVFLLSLPFIWQTNVLSSLLLAVNLPLLSVCDCVSICLSLSLSLSLSFFSAHVSDVIFSYLAPASSPCLLAFSISSLRSVLYAKSWTTGFVLHGRGSICCMSVIIPN